MGTPRSNWKFIFNGFIVFGLLYLKFFNPNTADVINEYYQLQALLFFLIFYFSVNMLAYAAKYFYSKKNRIPWNKKNNVHFGIENIARFIIGLALIILIITLLGVDPLEFITSLTIVAAAIAILTKEYIVDFLSGIYLSFSNTFEVGDVVKIDNQKGKIVEISMLKVKIKNDDDDVVIIPNSKVHYNEIINYTRKDVRLMSIEFQIALKHIDNIEKLEKDIIHSLTSFREHIEPKSYNLKVVEMKMDHLDVKFQYTLKVSDQELQRKIRKKTIREVFNFISSRKRAEIENSDVNNL
jgi:small-conductance mechanosensitive channel